MSSEHSHPSISEQSRMNRTRTLSDAELLKGGAEYDGDRLVLTQAQIAKISDEYQYGQEEIDRTHATRTLSDAELIQGGAYYENGVLKLTDEQLESLRNTGETLRADEVTAAELGQAAIIRYNEHDILDKSLEEMEREEANRHELNRKVREVLEPYEGILLAEVPSAETNERNWRGKIKEAGSDSKVWVSPKKVGDFDALYRVDIGYKLGKEHNTLSRATVMVARNEEDAFNWQRYISPMVTNPMLMVNYSPQQGISKLEVKNINHTDAYKYTIGEGSSPRNALGSFVDKALPVASNIERSVTINLADTPSISLAGSPWLKNAWASGGGYQYDAVTDRFELHPANSPNKLKSISVDEFVEILRGTLDIIPTTKVSL